jgi:outer membrane protein assembly factor BamE (lipoprotein component of BamABCDE complex)
MEIYMNNFKLSIIVLIFLLSSCTKTIQNNGFSNKKIENFDIKIGQTTKNYLLKNYGPPIFENVFKENVMYYISHSTSYKTFDERKTEKLLVLEITLDNKNIVQKIKKYSNKDSQEIKVSKNQEKRNINFTNFWKDIVRVLRRKNTED